jgi:hypothetical protein
VISDMHCQRIDEDGSTHNQRRIAELEAQLRAIREVIPMNFLQRNDAPGASGPTENLDLVGAVREMVSQSRKWETRVRDLSKST